MRTAVFVLHGVRDLEVRRYFEDDFRATGRRTEAFKSVSNIDSLRADWV
jgi:hypothetical protein